MRNPLSFFFKDTKPFGQLVGLFFLFVMGFVLCAGVQYLLGGVGLSDVGTRVRVLLVGEMVQQIVLLLLPSWCFVKLFGGSFREFFHVDFRGDAWKFVLVGVVVMLLLMPLVDRLSEWNQSCSLFMGSERLQDASTQRGAMTESLLSQTGVGDMALQVLCICLVPAICEELFFRGALQQVLGRCVRSRHVAVWVTAMIFSVVHGDVYGLVPRLVMGLLLGYVYVRSGSIVVSMCVHFVNNLMVVSMYQLYWRGMVDFDPGSPIGFAWGVIVPCALGAGLLYAIYFLRPKDGKKEVDDR